MSDQEHFLQIIADFIKGKGGPVGADIAALSFEGDFDPTNFKVPALSKTFADFSREYHLVRVRTRS